MVFGFSLCFECILLLLLFLNVDDARRALHWLDPAMGMKLPYRMYAEVRKETREMA